MKNIIAILGVIISSFFCSVDAISQTNFNLVITDEYGRPAENVLVTFDDKKNNICPFGITDAQGKVSFLVHQIPELVFAYDSRAKPAYGATCLLINQSRDEYYITIPLMPKDKNEILNQINNIYEKVRTFHGYYSTFEFIQKATTSSMFPGSSGLGVPGLFSLSILPTFEDGKPYIEVSGVVADFIFSLYTKSMSQIGSLTGNDFIYIHGGQVAY